MNRKIQIFAFATVLVAAIATLIPVLKASGKDGGSDPVVATVNGKEIHKSEVMSFTENLPAQMKQAPAEQIQAMIVDQLINTQLLDEEAKKENLAEDKDVQKLFEEAKAQIVRNAFLERKVSKLLTDDKLKKEYDKLVDENKDKKEARAKHILVKTEEEAKAILQQLKDGADFAKLAIEKSADPMGKNGGDLGYFGEDAMVPEFSKAVFAAKPGKLMEAPVKTQFGWHVVFVDEIRQQKLPAFDEIKAALKSKMGQSAVQTVLADLRKEASIQRFNMDGSPLEEKPAEEAKPEEKKAE